MVKPVRKNANKSPPYFSHEFIIQNHADIVSCVAMVFVMGLMMQATAPLASVFIALQHNITAAGEIPLYQPGIKDWAGVFFYSLIIIVIHGVIQEYCLDKISKKLHLSKSKLAVFNTSGQLVVFYAISAIWGVEIIAFRERYIPEFALLWENYPAPMSFMLKLYFIVQLGYCLHELPELYFQRTKKEEYVGKALRSLASLALIAIPYFLNFNRLLVCLLVFHYISELIHHVAQLFQTVDKEERYAKLTSTISSIGLILARLGSVVLAVLTLWYGMAQGDQKELNFETGNYNIAPVRLVLLASILVLQFYLSFSFISKEVAKARESKATPTVVQSKSKTQKRDKKKSKKTADESDLPEVDQNTNKNLQKQKVK